MRLCDFVEKLLTFVKRSLGSIYTSTAKLGLDILHKTHASESDTMHASSNKCKFFPCLQGYGWYPHDGTTIYIHYILSSQAVVPHCIHH